MGPARTQLAGQVLGRLATAYRNAADPGRARGMAAYMRGHFAFLGIPTPVRRSLDRVVVSDLPPPTENDLAAIARGCWDRPEREFQYFATDYLCRHVGVASADFIDEVETLVLAKSWWDTVDALAANAVGPMVTAYPALTATVDGWLEDDNIWLVRTAILHQLRYRGATDTERLWGYCERRGGHSDFFIRKAIGWALREYSKTDAGAVEEFVRAHASALSPLSRREALKWLERTVSPNYVWS